MSAASCASSLWPQAGEMSASVSPPPAADASRSISPPAAAASSSLHSSSAAAAAIAADSAGAAVNAAQQPGAITAPTTTNAHQSRQGQRGRPRGATRAMRPDDDSMIRAALQQARRKRAGHDRQTEVAGGATAESAVSSDAGLSPLSAPASPPIGSAGSSMRPPRPAAMKTCPLCGTRSALARKVCPAAGCTHVFLPKGRQHGDRQLTPSQTPRETADVQLPPPLSPTLPPAALPVSAAATLSGSDSNNSLRNSATPLLPVAPPAASVATADSDSEEDPPAKQEGKGGDSSSDSDGDAADRQDSSATPAAQPADMEDAPAAEEEDVPPLMSLNDLPAPANSASTSHAAASSAHAAIMSASGSMTSAAMASLSAAFLFAPVTSLSALPSPQQQQQQQLLLIQQQQQQCSPHSSPRKDSASRVTGSKRSAAAADGSDSSAAGAASRRTVGRPVGWRKSNTREENLAIARAVAAARGLPPPTYGLGLSPKTRAKLHPSQQQTGAPSEAAGAADGSASLPSVSPTADAAQLTRIIGDIENAWLQLERTMMHGQLPGSAAVAASTASSSDSAAQAAKNDSSASAADGVSSAAAVAAPAVPAAVALDSRLVMDAQERSELLEHVAALRERKLLEGPVPKGGPASGGNMSNAFKCSRLGPRYQCVMPSGPLPSTLSAEALAARDAEPYDSARFARDAHPLSLFELEMQEQLVKHSTGWPAYPLTQRGQHRIRGFIARRRERKRKEEERRAAQSVAQQIQEARQGFSFASALEATGRKNAGSSSGNASGPGGARRPLSPSAINPLLSYGSVTTKDVSDSPEMGDAEGMESKRRSSRITPSLVVTAVGRGGAGGGARAAKGDEPPRPPLTAEEMDVLRARKKQAEKDRRLALKLQMILDREGTIPHPSSKPGRKSNKGGGSSIAASGLVIQKQRKPKQTTLAGLQGKISAGGGGGGSASGDAGGKSSAAASSHPRHGAGWDPVTVAAANAAAAQAFALAGPAAAAAAAAHVHAAASGNPSSALQKHAISQLPNLFASLPSASAPSPYAAQLALQAQAQAQQLALLHLMSGSSSGGGGGSGSMPGSESVASLFAKYVMPGAGAAASASSSAHSQQHHLQSPPSVPKSSLSALTSPASRGSSSGGAGAATGGGSASSRSASASPVNGGEERKRGSNGKRPRSPLLPPDSDDDESGSASAPKKRGRKPRDVNAAIFAAPLPPLPPLPPLLPVPSAPAHSSTAPILPLITMDAVAAATADARNKRKRASADRSVSEESSQQTSVHVSLADSGSDGKRARVMPARTHKKQ